MFVFIIVPKPKTLISEKEKSLKIVVFQVISDIWLFEKLEGVFLSRNINPEELAFWNVDSHQKE